MSEPSALTVIETPAEETPPRGRSETFCIRLWQHMRLEASGEARVCCDYTRGCIEQDGVRVSTDRQSLMEIWNADTMRELRRAMVEGRRVDGCEECYTAEAHGGVSTRLSDNMAWERAGLRERRATFDEMTAEAVDHDFSLPKLPAIIEVEADNLCNFKCRMCNSASSSLIAKDPVQRKWDRIQHSPHEAPEAEIDPGKMRRAWPIESLIDELAKDTGSEVKQLSFLGGEPFLLPQIPRLLERLVAAGRAGQMSLLFISNGSVVPEWLSLAAQFSRVDVAISVDGYANDYEYIRFPGRWSKLTHNLQLLRRIPNVTLSVTTTIQVNNVLGITRLFRYLDSVEICFTGHLLHYPGHHAVSALPSSIRRLAASRLREYAEDDCRLENRAQVLSFVAQMEASGDSGDPGRLRNFMLFTNDLDASRGQSIRRTDPELVALLEQAGFPWLDETRYAPADGAMRVRRHRRLVPKEVYSANVTLQRELGATVKSLRDELVQTRGRSRMAEEQARIHEEAARIRDEEARTREDAARPRDEEVGRMRLELARVRLGFDQVCAAIDQGRGAFDQVRASRSWRMMRPLRSAGRTLRRWLPGGSSRGKPAAG